jgi:hypothetical protein
MNPSSITPPRNDNQKSAMALTIKHEREIKAIAEKPSGTSSNPENPDADNSRGLCYQNL